MISTTKRRGFEMKYYLDCEFNGMGGELLSLALVPEAGNPLYLIREDVPEDLDPWVAENVMPIMHADYRGHAKAPGRVLPLAAWAGEIESYLYGDIAVTIIADWPDDIKYFCELVITGPGKMIEVRPAINFEMVRVDAYPTELVGAVQHNAYWDALALRNKLEAQPPTRV